jgi:hypothetical protein
MKEMNNETIKQALSRLLDDKITYAMELEVDYKKHLDDLEQSELTFADFERKFDKIADKIEENQNSIEAFELLIDELN